MAAKRINMGTIQQVLRLYADGRPIKQIAKICGLSKNTVKNYIRSPALKALTGQNLAQLEEVIFEKPIKAADERYEELKQQKDYFLKELKRVGVTRYLLWQEYLQTHPGGYSYTQFCIHLKGFAKSVQFSMMMDHKPANHLYIDFSGKKMCYYEVSTGQQIQVEVLVAVLGYSQKAFVIALPSQKTEDFIYGLNWIMQQIGGVVAAIVPDNMKTAVVQADRYEPGLNRILEDFANHYNTTIIPTRAAHPKDKSLAEILVNNAYQRIYAPLRDHVFTDIHQINKAIQDQLVIHNNALFQRKEFTRQLLFDQESPLLKPLPSEGFLVKKYRAYKVQKNSHILLSEDNHYYSVPHAYIGQQVEVIYTRSKVYIYHRSKPLTDHIRSCQKYGYSTYDQHLPSWVEGYKTQSASNYLNRAANYSTDMHQLIDGVLKRKRHPEQNYKSCDGIFNLAHKTPRAIFENACKIALLTEKYNYTMILQVINNGAAKNYRPPVSIKTAPNHENIRGRQFFEQTINQ